MRNPNYPFTGVPISEIIEDRGKQLDTAIASRNRGELLAAPTHEVAGAFASRFRFHVPALLVDDATFSDVETGVNISGATSLTPFFGERCMATIPFVGDAELFNHRLPYDGYLPCAWIIGNKMKVEVLAVKITDNELTRRVAYFVESVSKPLECLAMQVAAFNDNLLRRVTDAIGTRRESIDPARVIWV